MTTAGTNLNPSAAGLPSEGQLLAWAAELEGVQQPVPAVSTGTDWAQIASEVLRDASSAPTEAYTPTLVSATNAADVSAVANDKAKPLPRSSATVGSVPVDKLRADFPILQEPLSSGKRLV